MFTAGKWGGVRNEVGVGGRDEVFWNTVRLEKKMHPKIGKSSAVYPMELNEKEI